MVYIKTMGQTDDGYWIVNEGVKVGDTILTSGIQKVIPGNPVKIVQSAITENTTKVKKDSLFNILKHKILKFIKK